MCAGTPNIRPPQTICEIRDLRLLIFENIRPGIYFLCFKDTVTYVGKTVRGIIRPIEHVLEKQKRFDRIYFMPCSEQELSGLERHWIRLLKPHYNVEFNPDRKYPASWLIERS
jgi:excinuclease UvrABC nuclease subunit